MRKIIPFLMILTVPLVWGCKKADPIQEAQTEALQQLDVHIDTLRLLVEEARADGKKWKTARWRESFDRFADAETPIYHQLGVLRTAAKTIPYRPEQITAWLDQLAERRMEIARIHKELTTVASKTKNGKAVIGAPSSATTPRTEAQHK